MKKQAASQRYHHSSGDEESLKDFNEIKTLQEDERRRYVIMEILYSYHEKKNLLTFLVKTFHLFFSKSFIHQPSVISDSTTPSTSICVTEVPSPAREDLMLEMNKLRSLCSNIELDFNSAKNDLSHLQETVMNLQKACDNVDGKMEKFANQMKCMERQQAIMLNVRFRMQWSVWNFRERLGSLGPVNEPFSFRDPTRPLLCLYDAVYLKSQSFFSHRI